MSLFSKFVPALVKLAFVFRNIFRQCLERPVWRSVRNIQEERFPGLIFLVNKFNGMASDLIREVVAVGFWFELFVILHKHNRIVSSVQRHGMVIKIICASTQ